MRQSSPSHGRRLPKIERKIRSTVKTFCQSVCHEFSDTFDRYDDDIGGVGWKWSSLKVVSVLAIQAVLSQSSRFILRAHHRQGALTGLRGPTRLARCHCDTQFLDKQRSRSAAKCGAGGCTCLYALWKSVGTLVACFSDVLHASRRCDCLT